MYQISKAFLPDIQSKLSIDEKFQRNQELNPCEDLNKTLAVDLTADTFF